MSKLENAGSSENLALPLKVYWQPGCSSCLKTKEFLIENGIPFQSINVLEDKRGFEELERLGIRLVPIVARGSSWANGAVFRDVAKVAGFKFGEHEMLLPREIKEKIVMILEAAMRFARQIPEKKLDIILPGRPRSYRQLVYHVFDIPMVFLDRVEYDKPYTYEALKSILPDEMVTKNDLLEYGEATHKRFITWWDYKGREYDFNQPGKVYYGEVKLHEVLERTAWHAGQHTRQIMLVLRDKLNIQPNSPLKDTDFNGLPMPKNIWDNERSFGESAYTGNLKNDAD